MRQMLNKNERLQIENIQIDIILTSSTNFTLTPAQQLNAETHKTTKKAMTSLQSHGTTLKRNVTTLHFMTRRNGNMYEVH